MQAATSAHPPTPTVAQATTRSPDTGADGGTSDDGRPPDTGTNGGASGGERPPDTDTNGGASDGECPPSGRPPDIDGGAAR